MQNPENITLRIYLKILDNDAEWVAKVLRSNQIHKLIIMENTDKEIELDSPLEEEASGNYKGRKIYTDKGDPDIKTLYGNYKDGFLNLQPDFQRYFVWDMKKASRLIESILLEIPLPTIYTSQEKDGKEYIIDGQQRMTSIFSFMDGKFPDDREFRLTGLNTLDDLSGKLYTEIGETNQRQLKGYYIHKIMFKQESDPNLKFEIFERLNTGTVPLNHQELRNCVYRGKYNDFIKELANYDKFRKIFELEGPEKRMRDAQLVLRFLSFYNKTYLNYEPPIKDFLNEDMKAHKEVEDELLSDLRTVFKNAVDVIYSMLGDKAFKRFYVGKDKDYDGYWGTRFNASLYDILMYQFAREDKNKLYQNLDALKEALIYLMTTDNDFIRSIEISTSTEEAVTSRFDKWRATVQEIVGISKKEPRGFSNSLKKELWKKDSTCKLCGNEIKNLDDAHIDHIEQYWLGGKTIPENARLTHSYCNLSRSRTV